MPKRIGHLELLDLPGRWKQIDAFGRGRIDTEREDSRAAKPSRRGGPSRHGAAASRSRGSGASG